MNLSAARLVLAPDAPVDLHLHTTYSDGAWAPEQLLDYLLGEHFALVAIADHDRADTAPVLQQLALDKGLPVLVAVEMTSIWKGGMTDVLCFGFDPARNALDGLARDLLRRQCENTREVYENLQRQGHIPGDAGELAGLLEKPGSRQPHELAALLERHAGGKGGATMGKILTQAGCEYKANDIAEVAAAAHRSGAVCLIAHPGRGDGFICYDADLLDQLRREVPVDGLEVYYPLHTPEQTAMYREYAREHHLLTSSGSDSHRPDKKPIKYRAEMSRELLERVGIRVG